MLPPCPLLGSADRLIPNFRGLGWNLFWWQGQTGFFVLLADRWVMVQRLGQDDVRFVGFVGPLCNNASCVLPSFSFRSHKLWTLLFYLCLDQMYCKYLGLGIWVHDLRLVNGLAPLEADHSHVGHALGLAAACFPFSAKNFYLYNLMQIHCTFSQVLECSILALECHKTDNKSWCNHSWPTCVLSQDHFGAY